MIRFLFKNMIEKEVEKKLNEIKSAMNIISFETPFKARISTWNGRTWSNGKLKEYDSSTEFQCYLLAELEQK